MKKTIFIIVLIFSCLQLSAADSLKVKKNIVKLSLTSQLLPLHTLELAYERGFGERIGLEAGGGYIPRITTASANQDVTSQGFKIFLSPKFYFRQIGNQRAYISPMFIFHHFTRKGLIYGMGGLSYFSADYYQTPEVEYDVYEFAMRAGAQGTGRIHIEAFFGVGVTSVNETINAKRAYPSQVIHSPQPPFVPLPPLQQFPFKLGVWLSYTF